MTRPADRDDVEVLRRRLAASTRALLDRAVDGDLDARRLEAALSHVASAEGALGERGSEDRSLVELAIEASDDATEAASALHRTEARLHPFAEPTNALLPTWAWEGEVAADRLVGSLTFGRAHEGPPGIVHGGSLAMACDVAVGVLARRRGWWAFTRTMEVRYFRACPIGEPLRWEVGVLAPEGHVVTLVVHVDDAAGRRCLKSTVQLVLADVDRFRSRTVPVTRR